MKIKGKEKIDMLFPHYRKNMIKLSFPRVCNPPLRDKYHYAVIVRYMYRGDIALALFEDWPRLEDDLLSKLRPQEILRENQKGLLLLLDGLTGQTL